MSAAHPVSIRENTISPESILPYYEKPPDTNQRLLVVSLDRNRDAALGFECPPPVGANGHRVHKGRSEPFVKLGQGIRFPSNLNAPMASARASRAALAVRSRSSCALLFRTAPQPHCQQQEKSELSITAESVGSADERFTSNSTITRLINDYNGTENLPNHKTRATPLQKCSAAGFTIC